VQYSKYTF